MQSFNELLQRLADSGIPFVIVGGYAAVAYGSTLVTRDLDICALLSSENVAALRRVLADSNPRHRMTAERLSFLEPPKADRVRDMYLETDVGVIDILSEILGVGDFERLRQKAETVRVAGREYRLIALEDLIAAKEAMGREKDLLAVKELRAIASKRKQARRQ
jgi:predicted nucleotidyltransferase